MQIELLGYYRKQATKRRQWGAKELYVAQRQEDKLAGIIRDQLLEAGFPSIPPRSEWPDR